MATSTWVAGSDATDDELGTDDAPPWCDTIDGLCEATLGAKPRDAPTPMPILTGCARADGGGIVVVAAPAACSSTVEVEAVAATAPSEGGKGAAIDDDEDVAVVISPSFALWTAVSDAACEDGADVDLSLFWGTNTFGGTDFFAVDPKKKDMFCGCNTNHREIKSCSLRSTQMDEFFSRGVVVVLLNGCCTVRSIRPVFAIVLSSMLSPNKCL